MDEEYKKQLKDYIYNLIWLVSTNPNLTTQDKLLKLIEDKYVLPEEFIETMSKKMKEIDIKKKFF